MQTLVAKTGNNISTEVSKLLVENVNFFGDLLASGLREEFDVGWEVAELVCNVVLLL